MHRNFIFDLGDLPIIVLMVGLRDIGYELHWSITRRRVELRRATR